MKFNRGGAARGANDVAKRLIEAFVSETPHVPAHATYLGMQSANLNNWIIESVVNLVST